MFAISGRLVKEALRQATQLSSDTRSDPMILVGQRHQAAEAGTMPPYDCSRFPELGLT